MTDKPTRKAKPRARHGLRFNLTDGGMKIDFSPGLMAELMVDGKLQAEIGLGAAGPEDFRRELREARSAQAACSMLKGVLAELLEQHRKPDHRIDLKKRSAAWAAGLEAGLRGDYRVIGQDPEHSIKGTVVSPEYSASGPSYFRGWNLGTSIFAAVYMSEHGVDPRKEWGA